MAKATKKSVKSTKAVKAVASKSTAATPANLANDFGYRANGGYQSVIAALKTLGVGKAHPQDKVIAAVKTVMTKAGVWKAFEAKEARNEATAKDAFGRVWQNVTVLTRKKDYGKQIIDAGYEVRVDGRSDPKTAGLFKLGK